MRLILDQDEEEIFFEIVLEPLDLITISENKGVLLRLPYGIDNEKNLNIFVRKTK
jgi:hypothetical protein